VGTVYTIQSPINSGRIYKPKERMYISHIPSWSSIISLGSIMPTLTMPPQKENLILNILSGLLIKLNNLMMEPLPLSQGSLILELLIGRV
jgi:hypothetical protein